MILVDLHGLGTVGLRGDGAQLGVQHVDGTVEQLVIRRVWKEERKLSIWTMQQIGLFAILLAINS